MAMRLSYECKVRLFQTCQERRQSDPDYSFQEFYDTLKQRCLSMGKELAISSISLQSSFYAIARAQKLMQESTSVSQTPRKSLVAMGNDGIYALTDTVPEGQRDETASNWCAATEVKSPAATEAKPGSALEVEAMGMTLRIANDSGAQIFVSMLAAMQAQGMGGL